MALRLIAEGVVCTPLDILTDDAFPVTLVLGSTCVLFYFGF